MLTLALLSTSCAAPKKVAESESRSEHSVSSQTSQTHQWEATSTENAEIERIITARFEAWLAAREERESELERDVEIYDSRQPADSATGTPPLLARVRERQRARIRNETDARATGTMKDSLRADTAESLATSGNTAVHEEYEGTTSSENKVREKKGNNRAYLPVAALLLLCLSATVYAIFKRHSNNH